MHTLIPPHGGKLVNRILEGKNHEELEARVGGMERLTLTPREISDLEMIAVGAFSPLKGFMTQDDYGNVVDNMRLKNGLPWTIPITLSVKKEEAGKYREGDSLALCDGQGSLLGALRLNEKYAFDKEREASQVYRTTDSAHPGVAAVYAMGETLLGGEISIIHRPKHTTLLKYRLDPIETRVLFKNKGWRRIVAFQTRNPIHRAHEYIQKCALESVDGLLIHPLVGETKKGDISAELRMKCYETIIEHYYSKTRTVLSVLPANMRYAGPREAIFHAIMRKNYGCTHFIVGRDHAGVGDYYGTFDAHYIFDEFDPEDLGITPMFFDYTFYCKRCAGMASNKTCPHDSKEHVFLSGTKVRQMLFEGVVPPLEFTRPEVANVLIEGLKEPGGLVEGDQE